MGTPEFASRVLKGIVADGHEVAAVYSQPPRRAGRGKQTRPSRTHTFAEGLGLNVYCPQNFQDPATINYFKNHHADVAVVVAYGLILPQAVLDAPKYGCLNIHASLLPRWRGAAPVQRAIMEGDEITGISVMQMQAGLDTGPVLMRRETKILPNDTTASLSERLAQISCVLMRDTLAGLPDLTAEPQPDKGVTYASKIDKAEARIDWTNSSVDVDRQIRGLSPFPGAWCEISGQRIKLLLSELADGSGRPGEVLDDQLTIACGSGAIRLLRLQRSGKSAAAASDFLRGFKLSQHDRLD